MIPALAAGFVIGVLVGLSRTSFSRGPTRVLSTAQLALDLKRKNWKGTFYDRTR